MKRTVEFKGRMTRMDYDPKTGTFITVVELHPFLAVNPKHWVNQTTAASIDDCKDVAER